MQKTLVFIHGIFFSSPQSGVRWLNRDRTDNVYRMIYSLCKNISVRGSVFFVLNTPIWLRWLKIMEKKWTQIKKNSLHSKDRFLFRPSNSTVIVMYCDINEYYGNWFRFQRRFFQGLTLQRPEMTVNYWKRRSRNTSYGT